MRWYFFIILPKKKEKKKKEASISCQTMKIHESRTLCHHKLAHFAMTNLFCCQKFCVSLLQAPIASGLTRNIFRHLINSAIFNIAMKQQKYVKKWRRKWSQTGGKISLWWWCIKGCQKELKSRREEKICSAERRQEERTRLAANDEA